MPGRQTPDDPGGSSPATPPNNPNQAYTDGGSLPAPRGGSTRPGGDPLVPPPSNETTRTVNTRKVVTVERQISFSSTILDNNIGIPFGAGRKQVLKCCYRRRTSQSIYLAYLIGAGEIDALTTADIMVNGEEIADYVQRGWISSLTVNLGDGTPAPTFMSGHPSWETIDTEVFGEHAFIAFSLNIRDGYGYALAELPGTLNIEVTPSGRLIDDFRGGPDLPSRNPIVLAHWVMRNGRHWPVAKLGATTWTAAADRADEVLPLDSSIRFTFDKLVENRDPARVVGDLLQHARAHMYTDAAGVVNVWTESPPDDLGTFTTTAGTDVISGAGASSLAAGDFIFVNESTRKVLSVSYPDVTVHRLIGATGTAKVFRIGDFALGMSDWISPPVTSERNPYTVPEAARVRYASPDVRGQHEQTYPAGGSPERRLEATYDGCTVASMAARIAKHLYQSEVYEKLTLSARAGGRAAPLEPGDLIVISDDGPLDYFPVRVLDPVTVEVGGAFALRFGQYAIEPFLTNITATDPVNVPPVSTDPADPPTSATKIFGEQGNWDLGNLIPDPDNLEIGWTASNCVVVAGVNSTVISNTAGTSCYNRILVSGLNPTDEAFVTFLAKSSSTLIDWTVGFTGAAFGTLRGFAKIQQDGEFHRYTFRCVAGPLTHGIHIGAAGLDAGDLEIKRLRVRQSNFNPSLHLYERIEWNPAPTAGTTVARHVARNVVTNQVVGTANAAVEDLEIRTHSLGISTPPGEVGGISKLPQNTAAPVGEFDMLVRGWDGYEIPFPTTSHDTEERIFHQRLEETFDIKTATRAPGYAVTWDGSEYDHKILPPDISALTGYPTGFPDLARAGSAISFAKTTRTITLKMDPGPITVYRQGRPIEITVDKSLVLPDVLGMVFVYLDLNGDLGSVTTWDREALLMENVYVTAVYLDSDSPRDAIYIGDERHRMMEPETHYRMHKRWGAYIESGLGLGSIIAGENGNRDTHATVSVDSGVMVDEDLEHAVAAIPSPASFDGYYLSGVTPEMVRIPATGAPWHKGASRAYFNELSGGVWGLSEISSNNNFVLSHVVATNDGLRNVIWIMGQNEYPTRSAARAGAATEAASILSLIPIEESPFIGTLIGKTSATMSNTWAIAIQTTDEGEDYVDWRGSELSRGNPPSSHAALTDRDLPNQHPLSSITPDADYSLANFALSDVAYVDFELDGAAAAEGRLGWNSDDGTLNLGMPGGNVNLQIGQEHIVRCRNTTGSLIPNGSVVYITGSSGNKPLIALSQADVKATAIVFGVATEDISNNANGYVTTTGIVRDMDSSAIAEGGFAFLSATTAGGLTATPPTAPNYKARIGYCLVQHASVGVLLVTSAIAPNLASLSDVYGTPAEDDVPIWNVANERFEMGGAADLNIEDVDVALTSINTGQLAAVTDVNGAMNILDNLSGGVGASGTGTNFRNEAWLTWNNEREDASIPGIRVNADDAVEILDGELVVSDGLIDAQDNDIETTGNVISTECNIPRLQASHSITLVDGGYVEFARAFVAGADPSAASCSFHYEITANDGTHIQTETGLITIGMVRSLAGLNYGGASSKAAEINISTSGTLSVTFLHGTAGSDHVRCRCNANSSLAGATIIGRFIAIGNNESVVTWS